MLSAREVRVVSVDVTVVAEIPKLGPYRDAIRANIAGALELDITRVSVKATTNEGLGPIGRGEGIAAWAVAMVESP
jgi:2-C-methyl-D-erythritol 2,4-cyclodiphosphate synthase